MTRGAGGQRDNRRVSKASKSSTWSCVFNGALEKYFLSENGTSARPTRGAISPKVSTFSAPYLGRRGTPDEAVSESRHVYSCSINIDCSWSKPYPYVPMREQIPM